MAGPIFRRQVFYVPGYDPFHPRRYRELYRKEGALQAQLSGYRITQQAVAGGEGWRVEAQIEGRDVQADVRVLVWSDIVRASMGASIPATYLQMLRTIWAYLGTGVLFRLMRLRKGPIIAALYPVAALMAEAFAALLLGVGVWWLAQGVLDAVLATVVGLTGAAVAIASTLRWFQKHDNRIYAYYLMHDFAHSAQAGGRYSPAMEERLARFRHDIAEALRHPCDEVLIVGHSSGAHLAVSAVADLLRAGLPAGGPALSLLTLGQVVPMVSFLPDAGRLRADLRFLSESDAVVWVDVTAPGDGCAFALCDSVKVSGVATSRQRWPLIFSAAFSQTLRPESWAKLRRRYFRLHFQYLCAFDNLPGSTWDYDYFRITAGPQTLGQRYADRPQSRSRIERAASGHTSLS
jgi:hypothetical protein